MRRRTHTGLTKHFCVFLCHKKPIIEDGGRSSEKPVPGKLCAERDLLASRNAALVAERDEQAATITDLRKELWAVKKEKELLSKAITRLNTQPASIDAAAGRDCEF